MDRITTYDILIESNGDWLIDGQVASRTDIVRVLAEKLGRDAQGAYYIDMKFYECPVRVADAPFFCKSVRAQPGQLVVILADGRECPLKPGKIQIKNRIPYASLIWEGDTKLSRAAFQILTGDLVEQDGRYVIQCAAGEWEIEENETV